MIIPTDPFPICQRLGAAHAEVAEEIAAFPEDLWMRWPSEGDVSGEVRVVPLLLKYRPLELPPIEARARRYCPRTWELFGSDAVSLVVSRMQPGCRIQPHRDLDGPGHLRCHLGITIPQGAWMVVEGKRLEWHEGQCIVFDPRCIHEVANDGDTPRTILIVDFMPSTAPSA